MRRLARRLALALGALVALPALYVALSFALVLTPANRGWDPAAGTVAAYVASNGIHADLVLPVEALGHDWRELFPQRHFRADLRGARYVALGWGDREFYLHTPTWADLTIPRALRALSGRHPSLVHVTYLGSVDGLSRAGAMPLDEGAYGRLVEFVRATLDLDQGRAAVVPGFSYGRADAFFEARGSYSAIDTCNVWVGRALRAAGVTVPVWTPFDVQVMWHLPPPGG